MEINPTQPGTDQQIDALTEPGLLLELLTELKAKYATLETELATEKEAHLTTLQINEGLQAQIEELELVPRKMVITGPATVTKVPGDSFKVGDIDYVITVPAFHFGGSKITAEQFLASEELQAILVKEGVGFIKRKGDK